MRFPLGPRMLLTMAGSPPKRFFGLLRDLIREYSGERASNETGGKIYPCYLLRCRL